MSANPGSSFGLMHPVAVGDDVVVIDVDVEDDGVDGNDVDGDVVYAEDGALLLLVDSMLEVSCLMVWYESYHYHWLFPEAVMVYFDVAFSGMYRSFPELDEWRAEMEAHSAMSVLSADLRYAYFVGDP